MISKEKQKEISLNRIKKNGEKFKEILKERFPYIKMLEEYKGFDKEIKFYCENCKTAFLSTPHYFQHHDTGCKICGDGISFPNKVIRTFILQVEVEDYKFEYSPKWLNNKKMDCYFKLYGKEYCVEMDGAFHFEDNHRANQTVEETQKIDKEKQQLCEFHNITVIRINCNYRRHEEILQALKNSELKLLFNFDKINWEKLLVIANKSLVIEVCNYINQDKFSTTKQVANYFHIDTSTVLHYIKFGQKIGIVDKLYFPISKTYKPIEVEDLLLKKKYCFNNVPDFVKFASEELNLQLKESSIRASIYSNRIYFNRFKIKYVDYYVDIFYQKGRKNKKKSSFKNFCEYINCHEHVKSKELENTFNISKQLVLDWIKTAKKEKLINNNFSLTREKELDVYDNQGNFIKHFKTMNECVEYFSKINISIVPKNAWRVASGERKSYKNLVFQYT